MGETFGEMVGFIIYTFTAGTVQEDKKSAVIVKLKGNDKF